MIVFTQLLPRVVLTSWDRGLSDLYFVGAK
jgi:hypothetical protein